MPKLALVIDRVSAGANTIAEAMGIKRISPERAIRLRRYLTLINWGVGKNYDVGPRQVVLNRPEAVRRAVDKMAAFEAVGDLAPTCTTSKDVVANSLETDKGIWLARSNFTSGGKGITPLRSGDAIPDADFYVRYVPKTEEYRVHVVSRSAIFTQQKRRRAGQEQTNNQRLIRNHSNGWVFCENNIEFNQVKREAIEAAAVECTARLGLDFAAVDLIVSKETGDVVFLEANTRPGLESTRLVAAYRTAFSAFM